MSNPLNNFQEYFREIEAEMEALKAALRAKEEASRPAPPSADISVIGGIPVLHFQGQVEPFTLTVKQLEIVRACWTDVQGFLCVNAGTETPVQVYPESGNKVGRLPRTKETKGWAAERAAVLGVSAIQIQMIPRKAKRKAQSHKQISRCRKRPHAVQESEQMPVPPWASAISFLRNVRPINIFA